MRAEDVIVGIDVGTSLVKSVAFDCKGRPVALARRPNSFKIPRPGWAECDMEATWELVRQTLNKLVQNLPGGSRGILALSVSGNMGGAWLTDGAKKPIRPAILWNDGRAASVLNRWRMEGLIDTIFGISCCVPCPGFSIPLLHWIRDCESDTFEKARYLFFAKDWIRFKLTGELCTEESELTHVPWDAEQRGYSDEVFRLCGMEEVKSLFLPLVDSGAVMGHVHRRAAEETGLGEGIPVVAGLADVSASLVGAGAVQTGCGTIIIGTSCLNNVTVSRPVYEPWGVGLIFTVPNGAWARTLTNQTGTIAFDWFSREWAPRDKTGHQLTMKDLDEAVSRVPLGARGIVFHPYLNSTGLLSPVYEPRARARFWGLGVEHTRFDMLRSIYEGIALATADCFEHLPPFDQPVRLVGGAAKSRVWRQMFADATGCTLALLEGEEVGALGVAMLAGVAAGIWNSIDEAVKECCRVETTIEPVEENHEQYGRLLQLYRMLRRNLKEEYDMRDGL
jgi:sugar (pentulose or hexulose) kinase